MLGKKHKPEPLPPPRSLDERLRRHGFVIVSRVKDQEPMWSRNGVRMKQTLAVLLCDHDDRQS